MMKNLRLPVSSDVDVDLSMINTQYEGVIIGYKENAAVGFIVHDENGWAFQTAVDLDFFSNLDDNLPELISTLLECKRCTHFKVIEFNK